MMSKPSRRNRRLQRSIERPARLTAAASACARPRFRHPDETVRVATLGMKRHDGFAGLDVSIASIEPPTADVDEKSDGRVSIEVATPMVKRGWLASAFAHPCEM